MGTGPAIVAPVIIPHPAPVFTARRYRYTSAVFTPCAFFVLLLFVCGLAGVLITSLVSFDSSISTPLVSPQSIVISPSISSMSQSVSVTSSSVLSSPVNIYFLRQAPTLRQDFFNHSTVTTVPINAFTGRPLSAGYYRWNLPRGTYMRFSFNYNDNFPQLRVCLMTASAYEVYLKTDTISNCLMGSASVLPRQTTVTYSFTTNSDGEFYLVFVYPSPLSYINSNINLVMGIPTYSVPVSTTPNCPSTTLNVPCKGNPTDYILIQSVSAVNMLYSGNFLDSPRMIRVEVRNEISWWIPFIIACITFVILICIILFCIVMSIIVAIVATGKATKQIITHTTTTGPSVIIQQHSGPQPFIQQQVPYSSYPDIHQTVHNPSAIPTYEDPNAWRMNLPDQSNIVYNSQPQVPNTFHNDISGDHYPSAPMA